jgi:hypothetical protein
VDGSGNIYLAQHGFFPRFGTGVPGRIHKLSRTGELLAQWGDSCQAPGQVWDPAGVAVDSAGDIYVTDTGNHRILKLSSTGEPLAEWGRWGGRPRPV